VRPDADPPVGRQRRLFLFSAAAGLLFGYSITVGNDAIGGIRQRFSLSSVAEGIVVSSLIAGALAGCLIAGRGDHRRRGIDQSARPPAAAYGRFERNCRCAAHRRVRLIAPTSVLTGSITVAAILAFMACYAFSAGPIAWLLVTEVLPARIRARASAGAAGLNWSANLLVALLFPVLAGAPGQPARIGMGFLFFAVLSVGFLVFVRCCSGNEGADPVPTRSATDRLPGPTAPASRLYRKATR